MIDLPGEFARPVPVIGDATAASQRAADPAGWAFPAADRDAFYQVLRSRRDVRRYRPDAVPAEILDRVLGAGHAAPSVGHSQPWRFIVVRDAAKRERAALLADRERLRQAAQMEPDSARRLLDLQLDGIREAPIGVVVACDRRTLAAGVLGRATFPDADLWSCAAAIQNLWLAARAEGLGMGWVTLFRPAELAGLIAIPDGVVTLGWLCLGWPDERPPEPGLQRAGWSRRLPLADVVYDNAWIDTTPAPDSHLRTSAAESLRAPDQAAVVGARDRADRLLTPPGSLGVLDRAVDRVVALGHAGLGGGTLVLAAADHPVTALGVSAYRPDVTREVLSAAVAGTAIGARAAGTAGLRTLIVDAGVAGPEVPGSFRLPPARERGDLAHAPAMPAHEAERLLAAGRDIGRDAAGHGLVALGEIGVGNTTVAACLAAALLGLPAAAVVGLGSGADTAMLDRKRAVVAAALERSRTPGGVPSGIEGAVALLADFGGPEFAVLTGVVLGAAAGGAPVVLDGLATGVAALIAVGAEPALAAHLIAGQRSRERAHALVLTELGGEPLLDLRIRAGEGAGAALASGLLLAALAIRRSAARVTY